jgi:hypothetical protein
MHSAVCEVFRLSPASQQPWQSGLAVNEDSGISVTDTTANTPNHSREELIARQLRVEWVCAR